MNTTTVARRILVVSAWAAMLVVSDLPDILVVKLGGTAPVWMSWAKTGFLAAFVALTLAWRTIRPLRQYATILLVLFLALGLTGLVRDTAWFQGRFNHAGVSFFAGYTALYVLDVTVALTVLAALRAMRGDRRAFFLVRGRLDAPIAPVRWLGIRAGESWRVFGWIFAGIAGLGVAVPTFLGLAPAGGTLLKALPLVPLTVLFAAVNAFTEEAYFRCSLLSTLHEHLGGTQTLLLAAVFFGLGHWLYGSPPGLVGFLMTGFLAWVVGKAMLETEGFFWPWFIHFVPDVVIFFSYALGSVQS